MEHFFFDPYSGRRAITLDNGTVQIQDRNAARGYRITDPHNIMRRLEAQGFRDIEWHGKIMTRRDHERSAWNGAIVARYPDGDTGMNYQDFVKFLLDHRGRESFRVQAGALRLECANQFLAAPLRIRHTDPRIDLYLDRPDLAAFAVRGNARAIRERTESLRGVPGGHVILGQLQDQAPRLHAWVNNLVPVYHAEDFGPEVTLWSAIQAITGVHRARLDALATLALTDGYDDLRAGRRIAAWPEPAPRKRTITVEPVLTGALQ